MSKKEELLNTYFKELYKIYNTGKATEPSFYPALKKLLESCLEKGLANVEEKKSGKNKPDFVIRKGKELVGYIEAKDFQKQDDLEFFDDDEQIKRYKKDFSNLILTNFFDFWLYRDGERIAKISTGFTRELSVGQIPSPRNERSFFELLELFFKYNIPEKRTAKSLATELAKRAKWIPENIVEELNNNVETEIDRIYKAFREYLISDLSKEDFADIYAQTITYGLFVARLRYKEKDFNRFLAQRLIPKNIQVIHDTFNLISSMALPESLAWIVDDIATVLAYSDIQEIKEELHRKTGDDPLMHFYETFLAEYDPKKRKARGVYYTPLPVVSYIIRSINILLKEKFDKKMGFASEEVTLLDPASGTLTFPANSIMIAKGEVDKSPNAGSWLQIVKNHILKDYYAFELLMAPYIIGHLKASLLLEELGYEFKNSDRFQLYLTNALDFKKYKQLDDPYVSGLSKEAVEAHRAKERERVLVIMGNPPYSVSSHNIIKGNPDYEEVYNSYKEKVRKEEKNIQPLSDDYIKFIAFAHWKIQQNGQGIVGMITNNSYLDGLIHRDMRQKLTEAFDEIYILNLHGSYKRKEKTPDGGKDENVFDIQQGVSIILLVKKEGLEKKIKYLDLYGLREEKYKFLENHDIKNTKWQELDLKEPNWFFVPRNVMGEKIYEKFISLKDIFTEFSSGVKTHRDNFILDSSKEGLKRKLLMFYDKNLDDQTLASTFDLKDTGSWKIREAREQFKKTEIKEELFLKYHYRPFDVRWIYYDKNLIERARNENVWKLSEENLALITTKQLSTFSFKHSFISQFASDICLLSLQTKESAYIFPLFIYSNNNENSLFDKSNIRTNFSSEFWKKIGENFIACDPRTIFNYIYVILHSNIYREKYNEFLKIDFPRIPFVNDDKLFFKVAEIGKELADLHLLKSEKLENPDVAFSVIGDNKVNKREYDKKLGRIYINDDQYFGTVIPEVWNYYIGGYQVLDKWLKDRIGKTLSSEDVNHYLKVVAAITYTIDLQKQIDKIYPEIEKNLI